MVHLPSQRHLNLRFSYMENKFQGCPTVFLYFSMYSGDKYMVRGSRFGHIFGRSKIHPKSIAIDQESLISHFGIIETPYPPY